jgi:DNA primase
LVDETREIRARIDIVELVGQKVSLKRLGKSWKGLCPFHEDKNPSFTVSAETGRYRCWACNEAGDIFNWVMKTQNVEFREALEILAKQAGVTLSKRGPQESPSLVQMRQTAMEEALVFFQEQLARSGSAQGYCERRGIPKTIREEWELGYAPDAGEALAAALKRKGLPLQECRQLFLVDQDASGGYFDKFRGRLMFAIRDERSRLVAFGGRLLGEGHPKYINSGDTPLFRKSHVLYGMHKALDTLRKSRQAVLVEGYLDVIACHRAGLTNALASLGTSLTEDHAKLLKRWVDEVVILYDSDAAGQKAAKRAVSMLQLEGTQVRIGIMPEGDDPDTLLEKGGAEALRKVIETAILPLEYDIQDLMKRRTPLEPEFWTEAVQALAKAPTEMELDRFVLRLAPLYPDLRDPMLAQKAIRRDVVRHRRGAVPAKAIVDASRAAPISRSEMKGSEVTVFRAFLGEEFRERAYDSLAEDGLFITGQANELRESILAAFPLSAPEGPPSLWLSEIEPESSRFALDALIFGAHQGPLSDEFVTDVVEMLKKDKQKRELLRIRQTSDLNTESRNDVLQRLKRLKNPDEVI